MKSRRLLYTAIGISSVLLLLSIFLSNTNEAGAHLSLVPTPAPTRTPGIPASAPQSVYPALAQPLRSEDQVINQVLYYDSKWASRDQPLSLSKVKTEPGLITIKWHSDRTYDGAEYGPGAELGPVWVVTIKGPVTVHTLDPRVRDRDPICASVTYSIAERTGDLLTIDPGPVISW